MRRAARSDRLRSLTQTFQVVVVGEQVFAAAAGDFTRYAELRQGDDGLGAVG